MPAPVPARRRASPVRSMEQAPETCRTQLPTQLDTRCPAGQDSRCRDSPSATSPVPRNRPRRRAAFGTAKRGNNALSERFGSPDRADSSVLADTARSSFSTRQTGPQAVVRPAQGELLCRLPRYFANASCAAISHVSVGPVTDVIPKTVTAARASTNRRIEEPSTPDLRISCNSGAGSVHVCAAASKARIAEIATASVQPVDVAR